MEWSRDLESGGGGFDSRLPEVGSGSRFRYFRYFREVSGSGLRTCLDRFGKVLEKMSGGSENLFFSKMIGSMFPESGRFRIALLSYIRTNLIEKGGNI